MQTMKQNKKITLKIGIITARDDILACNTSHFSLFLHSHYIFYNQTWIITIISLSESYLDVLKRFTLRPFQNGQSQTIAQVFGEWVYWY